MNVIFAGCGALGSRITIEVADYFDWVTLIDDDVVEENNIGTSIIFWREDVGVHKVDVLAEKLWRRYNIPARTSTKTLSRRVDIAFALDNYSDIVVDTFDNPQARMLTVWNGPTLHVGVGEVGNGSVIWGDNRWQIPIDFERGNNPVCTNQLGHQILQFTAAVAIDSIINFTRTREGINYIIRDNMTVVRL